MPFINFRNRFFYDKGSSVNAKLNHVLYTEYVRSKGYPMKDRLTRDLFVETTAVMFKEISKSIVESKGGVMINGFGYFFVWRIPRQRVRWKWGKGAFIWDSHTNGFHHVPIFLPAGGRKNLKLWSMDRKFLKGVKEGIKLKIKGGFRYKNYLYTLSSHLNR